MRSQCKARSKEWLVEMINSTAGISSWPRGEPLKMGQSFPVSWEGGDHFLGQLLEAQTGP